MENQKIRIMSLTTFIVSLSLLLSSMIWAMATTPEEILPLVAIGIFTVTLFAGFYTFMFLNHFKEWFKIAKEGARKRWSIHRIPGPILIFTSAAIGILLVALGFPISFRTYKYHEFTPIGPLLVCIGILVLSCSMKYGNTIHEKWLK